MPEKNYDWIKALAEQYQEKTGHCPSGPSSLKRTITCTASLAKIIQLEPPEASKYAQRGTILHEITARTILQGPEFLNLAPSINWSNECNVTEALDPEDLRYVEDALDFRTSLIESFPGVYTERVEIPGTMETWGLPQITGTCDLLLIDEVNSHAHVVDWKFGKGVVVYAHKNPQLMAYAAMAVGFPSSIRNITVYIDQPGVGHLDTYEFTYEELKDWVFEVVTPAIEQAYSGKGVFAPEAGVCGWCPVDNHTVNPEGCSARHQLAHKNADIVFAGINAYDHIREMPVEQAEELLFKIEQVMDIRDALMARLFSVLEKGGSVPYRKLVRGRANRRWKDEEKAKAFLLALAEKLAVAQDRIYTKKFVSPAQAEKLFKSHKKELEFLIEKPEGKLSMVSTDDPRESVTPFKEIEP